MKTVSLLFTSLPILLSVALHAQDMTMEAKEFNNRKEVSDERVRSDYKDATGRQFVTINVENSPSVLSLTYDIRVDKGETALLVKYQEEVTWEKEIAGREQTKCEIELPKKGKYLLIIDVKNASGEHDVKWKLSHSSGRE